MKIDMQRLRELLQQQPDATTVELHEQLNLNCSVPAADMALRRLGWPYKKRCMRPSRIGWVSPNNAGSGVRTSAGLTAGG